MSSDLLGDDGKATLATDDDSKLLIRIKHGAIEPSRSRVAGHSRIRNVRRRRARAETAAINQDIEPSCPLGFQTVAILEDDASRWTSHKSHGCLR